jgi:hypothetical protein
VRLLSEEAVQYLVECYLAGDSTYAPSRRFGVRRDTVSAHLRRHNISTRVNARILLEPNQAARIIELYRLGFSVKHAAEEVGISESAAGHTLREADLMRGDPSRD